MGCCNNNSAALSTFFPGTALSACWQEASVKPRPSFLTFWGVLSASGLRADGRVITPWAAAAALAGAGLPVRLIGEPVAAAALADTGLLVRLIEEWAAAAAGTAAAGCANCGDGCGTS